MSLSFKRYLALFLALLFGLAIAVLSVAPINRIAIGVRPRFGASAADIHHAALVHIWVHILIFAIAAGVAWLAACVAEGGVVGRLLAVTATMMLGFGTEYLEHAASGRAIELADVYVNLIASGVAFVALALVERYRRRLQGRTT
jgi:hypothetical protein